MARKSNSIRQEELYPYAGNFPSDSREELDDARLVDLDVDQESPFLRAQKRVSARRSSLPKKTAHRLLWGLIALGILGISAAVALAVYDYGEHSWRFRIDSSDSIEVTGNESKIDKFLMLMGKFGISELSRTGRVALARKPN